MLSNNTYSDFSTYLCRYPVGRDSRKYLTSDRYRARNSRFGVSVSRRKNIDSQGTSANSGLHESLMYRTSAVARGRNETPWRGYGVGARQTQTTDDGPTNYCLEPAQPVLYLREHVKPPVLDFVIAWLKLSSTASNPHRFSG
ncbi:hypothetical protein EVAR_25739_1 [Eumeta japonica]|uniref:Uncharacterized protein n=1 Tax=Eumeta variegata TaxID=151549 RepID=A0A4C1VAV6_EUMVA|nr:hypothetical protein EVAR_25739_1 [Eumeta japonica]